MTLPPWLLLILVGIAALIVTNGPETKNNVVLFHLAVFSAFIVGALALNRFLQLAAYDAGAGPLLIAAAVAFTGSALALALYSRRP